MVSIHQKGAYNITGLEVVVPSENKGLTSFSYYKHSNSLTRSVTSKTLTVFKHSTVYLKRGNLKQYFRSQMLTYFPH